MRHLVCGLVVIGAVAFGTGPARAESESAKAANCSTYANNRASSESSSSRGVLGGAIGGASGGALFGAIIGGRRGARRGAALGGGMGAIGGGAREQDDRAARSRYYYEACMRDQTR